MDPELIAKVDRTGRRQYGILTRRQAHEILGKPRTERWVRDGRLVAEQPGVVRLAGSPRTPHAVMVAASLSARGPISHRSSSWLWKLIDRPEEADVAIRYPRKATLWEPGVVHRIRDLQPNSALHRHRLYLTNPMRTIIDLGLVEPWWVVDEVLGTAIGSKLLSIQAVFDLRVQLARRGRNGTGVIQRVFDERLLRGADEDSKLELRLLDIIKRFELPPVTFQHEVWHEGRFVARVDAAYPHRKIAMEADGFASRSSPAAFETDRDRQNELEVLGWTVLRFTRNAIVRRPRSVFDRIKSVL